ncbi:hypothetical protein CL643_03305 [bacterium]|nr:hypothetical protein [bacterium]MBT02114.1 hypothetical protein [bacterium]|tara:strand:+ start:38862 stop:39740 length:879 start_codon:yes stop_codon:yes gene_type:complete
MENMMEMPWVYLIFAMVAGIILRMGWDWLVDSSTLMLAWDGFRKAVKDWRTFMLGAGAWWFTASAGSGFGGVGEDAWTQAMPWVSAAVTAGAWILCLTVMKGIWAGKANFKMVGDWLANPVKRAPEFLATAAGAGATIWIWGMILKNVPVNITAPTMMKGDMFMMPNVKAMVSGGADAWLWGSISLILIGLPAAMMVIHADGEDEGFVNSFTTALKRYPTIAGQWKKNLSWTLGVSLLGWAMSAIAGFFGGIGGGGMVSDLMMFIWSVITVAASVGVVSSLYGLKAAHNKKK